ncbi:MAG: Mov34/MPN/PAD-1 family protein [Candidatus Sericytochromatia bacterium]
MNITSDCLIKIINIAKSAHPKEIGSSLIGYYSKDGFDAYITNIVEISNDSKGTNNRFIRGTKGLKKFFSQLKSTQNQHYIGEWHSHPDYYSIPSNIDDNSQFDISNNEKVNCPECLLLIIGGDFFKEPSLGIFVYSKVKGRINLNPDTEGSFFKYNTKI